MSNEDSHLLVVLDVNILVILIWLRRIKNIKGSNHNLYNYAQDKVDVTIFIVYWSILYY